MSIYSDQVMAVDEFQMTLRYGVGLPPAVIELVGDYLHGEENVVLPDWILQNRKVRDVLEEFAAAQQNGLGERAAQLLL